MQNTLLLNPLKNLKEIWESVKIEQKGFSHNYQAKSLSHLKMITNKLLDCNILETANVQALINL